MNFYLLLFLFLLQKRCILYKTLANNIQNVSKRERECHIIYIYISLQYLNFNHISFMIRVL